MCLSSLHNVFLLSQAQMIESVFTYTRAQVNCVGILSSYAILIVVPLLYVFDIMYLPPICH